MIARTYTAMLEGLSPLKIEVEVDSSQGIPHLLFIGLTSQATEEAKERITTALTNCGIRIRSRRTVVNLAPADVPKAGSGFDLAIAIGLLKMYGEIELNTDHTLFLGELSLDGSLKSIRGALPLAIAARNMGFWELVLPATNAAEVSTLPDLIIHPLQHLRQYLAFTSGETSLPTLKPQAFRTLTPPTDPEIDFADIRGQETAKRALTIAAAGGHHLLMTGPPGVGKSLMAKAFISLLPPLTEQESIEVTSIHSVYDHAAPNGLWYYPPFRAPHHTTSISGLIGGGTQLRPGEISMAHRGVLFLDEFLEFNKAALEALRQPIEDGMIRLARAQGSATFPAKFLLIAATNPCPCGYLYSTKTVCKCNKHQINQYRKKLSGPIYDRFELHVSVQEIQFEKLTQSQPNLQLSSLQCANFILAARKKQAERYHGQKFFINGEVPSKQIADFVKLEPAATIALNQSVHQNHLSGRSYFQLLRIARTIADLESNPVEKITANQMQEALQYR